MDSKRPSTPKNGVWQVILDALYDNIGNLVSNERLAEITKQHNYARRLRELRAEGWQIKYQNSPSGYILLSSEKLPKEPGDYVNLRLRSEVFERDNHTCQICAYAAGEKYSDGELVKLEADHIIPLADGGQTTVDNLQTLCSRCNAGKKAVSAYSTKDDKISMVIRLEASTMENLEKEAKTHGVSIKQLVEQTLEHK